MWFLDLWIFISCSEYFPPLQFYFTFYLTISESPFLLSLSCGSDSAHTWQLRPDRHPEGQLCEFTESRSLQSCELLSIGGTGPKGPDFSRFAMLWAPGEFSWHFGGLLFSELSSPLFHNGSENLGAGENRCLCNPWGRNTLLSSVVANFIPGLNLWSFCFLIDDPGIAFSNFWKEKESINI